jgi:hypothetical protein
VRERRDLQQEVLDGKLPLKHHDVLVIPPERVLEPDEMFRVPVIKPRDGTATTGTYIDTPEQLDAYDYAQRRVMAVSRPQDWGATDQRGVKRGPAFGTLPVKREPAATSCASCYLINAPHINFRNAWTAEEWTDLSDNDIPGAPSANNPEFETLIAGPRGTVFHLEVKLNGATWTPDEVITIKAADGTPLGSITQLDLRYEMEIWNQLRNGTLLGRVLRRTSQTPVPLVNITTLLGNTDDGAPGPDAGVAATTNAGPTAE